jgi:GDP-L-fucose synthase
MAKTKLLLTGGGGMVGRNLLEHPALADYDVFAPTSRELDLRDAMMVTSYLMAHQPDIIVHSAGRVGGIQANMREPVAFLVDNFDMGRNLLLGAHKSGVMRVLNLGSSCMYPRNRDEPLREEWVLQGELEPTNEGYALAKIATARLGEYLMRENADFRCRTLIPCNLYGRYDKFDPKNSHLVPAIIHKVYQAKLQGQNEVEIWGDGTARREFMYAGDLADAIVQALLRFDDLPVNMNIGLGRDHTVNEYYAAAADVIGWRGRFVHDLSKPVGMARKLVDISRQTAWGWQPAHDLRTGLERTYHFYLEQQQ